MKRITLLLLLPIFLNACALCTLYTPKIDSKIEFNIDKNNLLGLNIEWVFSEKFTKQLLNSYDKNANNSFDDSEIKDIEKILIDYIKPKNFLTKIGFYDNLEEKDLKFKIQNYKINYKNEKIIFSFQISCLLELVENRTIKILLKDDEGFFDFKILQTKQLKLQNSLYLIPNINNQIGFYKISKEPILYKKKSLSSIPKLNTNQNDEKNYYDSLKLILTKYTNNIKIALQDIQNENSFKKMFTLLAFSFLYGFFHAIGPGHGKTLVGSYFLANGGNWYKALIFSFRIGIIHVISAFLLVIVSTFIIKTFISKVLNDISIYTSYISATIIICIALFMFYKKYTQTKHEECCSCHSHSSTKKDWGITIAAGIVPCAGTVVVFILAFTLGNYLIGFLSAFAMALGMGSVIFISSIFAQFLHVNIENRYKKFLNIIEYLTIIFILTLGILLLISPLKM